MKLPRGGIGSTLYNVERSLSSVLSFSFFITKLMKSDLHAGQVSGTLPILYVFLARSGKTVRDVSLISLDDKGAAYFANEMPARTRRAASASCSPEATGRKGRCIISPPIFRTAA